MPRVSIVIPAYNRADLIADTLRSVLDQTFRDIEVIVVDDGSTDDTLRVLERFAGQVAVLQQQNRGQGAARNTGIRASRSEFVAFVDSDDLWQPRKLERQLRLFEERPQVGWVFCDAEVFDHGSGKTCYRYFRRFPPAAGWVASELVFRCFVPSPTVIARREALHAVGLFDEDPALRQREDWALWLRLAARYETAFVSDALARYRVHAGSATSGEPSMAAFESRKIAIERAVAFAPDAYRSFRSRAIANVAFHGARRAVNGEGIAAARRLLEIAAAYDPSSQRIAAYRLAARNELLFRGGRHLLQRAKTLESGFKRLARLDHAGS